ncbi:MAG: carbon-nitrogen family hydrolase [Desulfobacteria bacterium]
MKPLHAGVIQLDVKSGDVYANLKKAREHIKKLADSGVRVMVLPEMWSTGFVNEDTDRLSQSTPGVLDEISRLAEKAHAIIIGSFPEKIGARIFNTAYVIDEQGTICATYQKIHLFSPTDEHRWFHRGQRSVVCPTSAGPVGLLICYDLRFPELCRLLALKGARILIVMAQWPAVRASHWETLLAARAIENQVFVLGANRCGQDNDLVYAGNSLIMSPYGETLARIGKRQGSITAVLDFDLLEQFRKTIPCFKERVPEAYAQ